MQLVTAPTPRALHVSMLVHVPITHAFRRYTAHSRGGWKILAWNMKTAGQWGAWGHGWGEAARVRAAR